MKHKNPKTDLSRTMSHALRHQPWLYELELDEEGWTPIEHLLQALQTRKQEWSNLTLEDLQHEVANNNKQRYEIQGERIRARYGHSIEAKIRKTPGVPPEQLYHGTAATAWLQIQEEGLRPMSRQYIHLSVDTAMAIEVGQRKSKDMVVLVISAAKAHTAGVTFYSGNDKVWLADHIPPDYIER